MIVSFQPTQRWAGEHMETIFYPQLNVQCFFTAKRKSGTGYIKRQSRYSQYLSFPFELLLHHHVILGRSWVAMEFGNLFLNEGCMSYDSDSSASHPNVSKLYVWNLRLEALIRLKQHMCQWQLLERPPQTSRKRPRAPPPLLCFSSYRVTWRVYHHPTYTTVQKTLNCDSFRRVKAKLKTWTSFFFLSCWQLRKDLVINWIFLLLCYKKKSLIPISLVESMKSIKNTTVWRI